MLNLYIVPTLNPNNAKKPTKNGSIQNGQIPVNVNIKPLNPSNNPKKDAIPVAILPNNVVFFFIDSFIYL